MASPEMKAYWDVRVREQIEKLEKLEKEKDEEELRSSDYFSVIGILREILWTLHYGSDDLREKLRKEGYCSDCYRETRMSWCTTCFRCGGCCICEQEEE